MKKKTNWEDFLTKIISFSGVAEHDYRVLTWLNAADGIKITNKRGPRINSAPFSKDVVFILACVAGAGYH